MENKAETWKKQCSYRTEKKKKYCLNIYYHQLKLLRSGKALMNIDLILDAQNYSQSILLLVQGEGNLTSESEGSWF